MTLGWKKVGMIAAVAAVALALGMFRPGAPSDEADASFTTPGGISAIPSGLPGIPGVTNQILPAIADAGFGPGGLGDQALVGAFCDLVFFCPNDPAFNVPSLTFRINRVYPDGDPAATFAASGSRTLVVADGATADLSPAGDNSVIVSVDGGGVNEVVEVVACENVGAFSVDEDGCHVGGDKRSVRIIFVETILAVSPSVASAGVSPSIVSYACDTVGPGPTGNATDDATDLTPGGVATVTLEDLWNTQGVTGGSIDLNNGGGGVSAANYDYGSLASCGGLTSSPTDDRVNFETDKGILTVEEMADISEGLLFAAGIGSILGATINTNCDVGDSISLLDSPAVNATSTSQLCDLDHAPNGVVSYGLLGTGDVGVASVTAQQSGMGGATVPRNINVTFTGAAALSLFITAPTQIGISGDDFSVALVDQDGRPVAGRAIECTVSPTGGALVILPQTGSTGSDGTATFSLVPTGASVLGGEELTITCVLDENRDIRATATVQLTGAPDRTTVNLSEGCNLKAFMPYYAEGTSLSTITGDIAGGNPRLWFQTGPTEFALFDPSSPERSGVTTLTEEAGFACVDEDTTWSRPA